MQVYISKEFRCTCSQPRSFSKSLEMRSPSSITLHYDASEDRILVAIDAGAPEVAAYWLTRRLALNLVQAANPYLDRMSPVLSKAPTAVRRELATMEREVALATTYKNLRRTPDAVLKSASKLAELARELVITQSKQGFGLKFGGCKGRETIVGCSRSDLQRIIHMVEQEMAKANWHDLRPADAPPREENETRRRIH